MLRAIFADAVFCAALSVELLALASILQAMGSVELREEFTPIMMFYHAKTAPLSAIGGSLFAGRPPGWFADAVLIAAVFFFLFFIEQARAAMAPYDDPQGPPLPEARGAEAAIDFVLPAAVCTLGAAVTAPTLLALLTLPVAVFLLLKQLFAKPSWFKVSLTYYVNVALLAGAAAALFEWAR